MLNILSMLDYTKVSPLVFDFNVAVTNDGYQITSPQLDLRISLCELPENVLTVTAQQIYRFCKENDIPLAGDTFMVTSRLEDFEKGGRFQGLFIPEPNTLN